MSFLDGKKTYLGILVAVVPTLAGFLGFSIDGIAEAETLLSTLVENIEAVSVTVGGLIAWYGRSVTKG